MLHSNPEIPQVIMPRYLADLAKQYTSHVAEITEDDNGEESEEYEFLAYYYTLYYELINLNSDYIPRAEFDECFRQLLNFNNSVNQDYVGIGSAILYKICKIADKYFLVSHELDESVIPTIYQFIVNTLASGKCHIYKLSDWLPTHLQQELVKEFPTQVILSRKKRNCSLNRDDVLRFSGIATLHIESPKRILSFIDLINFSLDASENLIKIEAYLMTSLLESSDKEKFILEFFRAMRGCFESGLLLDNYKEIGLFQRYISCLLLFKKFLNYKIAVTILFEPDYTISKTLFFKFQLANSEREQFYSYIELFDRSEFKSNKPRGIPDISRLSDKLYKYFLTLLPEYRLFRSPDIFARNNTVPFIYQLHMSNFSQDVVQEFICWHELLINTNARADEQHKRSVTRMLIQYHPVILQHIYIMKIDGIHDLTSKISGTLLALERYLSQLQLLPYDYVTQLSSMYDKQAQFMLNNNDLKIKWHNYVSTVMIYYNIYKRGHNEYKFNSYAREIVVSVDKCQIEADFTKEMEKFIGRIDSVDEVIALILNKILSNDESLTSSALCRDIIERYSIGNICKLLLAKLNMKESAFEDVFNTLIRLDFHNISIDAFIHDINQDDGLGKKIAVHNAAIRQKLLQSSIQPDIALNYQPTFSFTVTLGDQSVVGQIATAGVLWDYLKVVNAEIDAFKTVIDVTSECVPIKLHLLKLLDEIAKHINSILSKIRKNRISPAKLNSYLASTSVYSNFRSINKLLFAITRQTDKLAVAHRFIEFAKHAMTAFVELKMPTTAITTSNYQFTVKQWNKIDPMTFFLGDKVACCLASDGNQFRAMVQRRMDDAMIFHVVSDDATGQPIALAWLYLAEKENGKIALIANFTEIAIRYARDASLRLSILQGLLKFTHQYCLDNPNIDGFYIFNMCYGWNKFDLDDYPLKKNVVLLDKLGSAVKLDDDTDKTGIDLTLELYYLDSLTSQKEGFREFQIDIFNKNRLPCWRPAVNAPVATTGLFAPPVALPSAAGIHDHKLYKPTG